MVPLSVKNANRNWAQMDLSGGSPPTGLTPLVPDSYGMPKTVGFRRLRVRRSYVANSVLLISVPEHCRSVSPLPFEA